MQVAWYNIMRSAKHQLVRCAQASFFGEGRVGQQLGSIQRKCPFLVTFLDKQKSDMRYKERNR